MPKEKGQSLIEIVVTLAVTVVVLGALVITVLTGMKNAQFAQNQAKATKYAQEAIDQIRAIRDRNGLVTFAASPGCCTALASPSPANSCRFSNHTDESSVWRCNLSAGPCTVGDGSAGCFLKLSDNRASLEEITLTDNDEIYEKLENGLFLRQIFIEDSVSSFGNEKKVSVKVLWRDGSGDHQSFLQTYLTRY